MGESSSLTEAPTEPAVMDKLEAQFIHHLVSEEGSKTKYYIQTIRNNELSRDTYELQPYLKALNSWKQKSALAQFRTGSHWLNVEQGRFTGVQHEDRHCTRCSASVVDNEEHMIFECPALQSMREEATELFENIQHDGNNRVHAFLHQNYGKVSKFIASCREACA